MRGIDLNKPITYQYASMRYFSPGERHITRFCMHDVLLMVFDGILRFNEDNTEYEVHAGEYIGFVGKEILTAKADRYEAACATVDLMSKKGFEFCILIRGKDADSAEGERIEGYISSHYPGKEVYVIDGMQEIYDYILIVD